VVRIFGVVVVSSIERGAFAFAEESTEQKLPALERCVLALVPALVLYGQAFKEGEKTMKGDDVSLLSRNAVCWDDESPGDLMDMDCIA